MTIRKSTKDQAGKHRSGPSSSKKRKQRRAVVAALVVCALLAALFLIGRWRPSTPPPAQNATHVHAASQLERRVKRVEEALHRSLKAQHADLAALQVESTEPREHDGQQYPFTTLRLPQVDRKALHERLVKELSELAPEATLTRVAPDVWDISIDGLPTHRLNLPPEAPKPAPAPPKGRLAIVIDDMGEDTAAARELAALPAPITFSIWPDSTHHDQVRQIAKAAGRDVLVHMPMQPLGYPKVKPGPHPLLTNMSADQIKSLVTRAVQRVPGAIGVNNHMGSDFTQYRAGMRAALSVLKRDGLLFLDSRTTAATLGPGEAKKQGVRVMQRDVFLDNVQSVPAILKQLRQAEGIAKQRGHSIAIGHPHKQTIEAIRQWLKEKDQAVHVVSLSSLPAL